MGMGFGINKNKYYSIASILLLKTTALPFKRISLSYLISTFDLNIRCTVIK
jgi:hypothetical protein